MKTYVYWKDEDGGWRQGYEVSPLNESVLVCDHHRGEYRWLPWSSVNRVEKYEEPK